MRKRHVETQVYVGAFQYLAWKQQTIDRSRNEGKSKSDELYELFTLSRNLLCEIETAINKSCLIMPQILTREMMDQRLTFRNDKDNDIDSKFAKVRFTEYLHGLQKILENRKGKTHRSDKKRKHQANRLKLNIARNNNSQVFERNSIELSKDIIQADNLHGNDIDTNTVLKKHHKNGLKHRKRNGLGKLRKNKKKCRNEVVAGLGPKEIKNFRQQTRKKADIIKPIINLKSMTSTTTITPPNV